jgi:adenylosuccinate synthase
LVARGAYGKTEGVSFADVRAWVEKFARRVAPMVLDTSVVLEREAAAGKRLLFEAQLGALRDVYLGIYPFTTSSCALASFAPVGSGLFGHPIDRVVGVMKAFSTCVGVGPFVTEMQAEVADTLREVAFEYGAATGRPRRIGHFDAVASRFGAYVQGATEIALTKLDCLSGLPSLKICTAYRIRGESTTTFPLNSLLDEAEPVYLEMPGWTGDITACRRFDDLPSAAREYVRTIERLVGTRIRFVSVGPERSQMIETV